MRNKKPMDYSKFMEQQLTKEVESPVYCRHCGLNIKHPRIEAPDNWKQNIEWEIHYQTHTDCHQKYLRGM